MVRNDRPKLQQDDLLERVELPETTVRGLLRHFGPGLILMMTGVGTSHVVAAPVAGGRFEYALLWCIPVAYLSSITPSRWHSGLRTQPGEACSTPMRRPGASGRSDLPP